MTMLREVNPRLVYCAAYGYGQDGPLADRPAFDDIIQGASGFVALQQATGGEARFVPTLVGDKTVGLTMVYAVIAALFQRERTGAGQMVEVPMLETMAAFVMAEHLGGLTFDPPLGPPGYARMLAPDRRPHRTADGHICILPYSDRHWRDFFRVAGRPDLAADPRLADAPTRARHVAELYALIAECVRGNTTAYWLDRTQIGRHPERTGQPARSIAGGRATRRRRFLSGRRPSDRRQHPHRAAAGAVRHRRLRATPSGAAPRRAYPRDPARNGARRRRDRRSDPAPDRDRAGMSRNICEPTVQRIRPLRM